MKTITLKELACYLPFELQMKNEQGEIGTLSELNTDSVEQTTMYDVVNSFNNFNQIKPIVYPLSMLTQEIEHNGERFVPIERIKEFNPSWMIYKGKLAEKEAKCIVVHNVIGSIPYWIVELLLEWNFWIFDQSYFEEGLVIDKSKIK